MKVLLIEDNPSQADDLGALLRARIPECVLTVVGSRDAAIEILFANRFDYIICDLKMPSSDTALDAEVDHGLAVLERIEAHHTGTPRMILSAFATHEYALEVTEQAAKLDAIGDGHVENIVVYRTKRHLDKAVETVVSFAERLRNTVDIELWPNAGDEALSVAEQRLIQMLARRFDGRVASTSRIGGGLSKTTTMGVRVKDANGTLRAKLFVKTGSLELLQLEAARYERHVTPLLQIGLFAPLSYRIEAGAGSSGALAYALGEGRAPLTVSMGENPVAAAAVVAQIADYQAQWMVGGHQSEVTVAAVCGFLGTRDRSELTEHLEGLDYREFEKRRALIGRAVQHGDLHAENVLVDETMAPMLVDYGETGDLIAGFDPIALELSLLFHPKVKLLSGAWPTVAQAENWIDLDGYVAGCPQEAVVRECRRWALRVSPSRRALLACVYAHAVRQLGYPETDKEIARALIKGAIMRW